MTNDILQCALGVHRYDKETKHVFLCSICERASYGKECNGDEFWTEYDKNGKATHFKNVGGYEFWIERDEKGNMIHCKDSCGNDEDFLKSLLGGWHTIHYLKMHYRK